MILELTLIRRRRSARSPAEDLVTEYLKRAGRFHAVELREFGSEGDLLSSLDKARPTSVLFATDSRGVQVSSAEFAAALGTAIDGGVQRIVVAVGPADGWSAELLGRARLVVAFGRITLPHELAAVIAAEQIYRALSIRAGHPYHCGH